MIFYEHIFLVIFKTNNDGPRALYIPKPGMGVSICRENQINVKLPFSATRKTTHFGHITAVYNTKCSDSTGGILWHDLRKERVSKEKKKHRNFGIKKNSSGYFDLQTLHFLRSM